MNEPKTMCVAVFKRIDGDWETLQSKEWESFADYVRVSDYAEVTFNPLSNGVQIQHHLEAINREEQEIRAQFGKKLDNIKNMRAQLLALPHIEA